MALFKKKQTSDTTTPSELQEYYQAENRERRGMAWLLAFITFAVTLIIVLILFFAGRWLYQRFHKTTQSPQGNTQTTQSQSGEQSKNESNNKSGGQPSSNSNSSTNQQGSGTAGSNTPAQGTQNTAPQTSSTSTSTPSPATSSQNNQLPRTGPDEDL